MYFLRVSFPRFTHIIVSRKRLVNYAVMISIGLGVLRSNVSTLFEKIITKDHRVKRGSFGALKIKYGHGISVIERSKCELILEISV